MTIDEIPVERLHILNKNSKKVESLSDIRAQLIDLALKGLRNMYDEEKGLFCFRVVERNGNCVREGLSLRYTLITLLGLEKARRSGLKIPFDLEELFKRALVFSKEISDIGDYGLLLWTTSNISPQMLPGLTDESTLTGMLRASKSARENKTMEMAWFLTGLCYALRESNRNKGILENIAKRAYSLLMHNYGGKGIFGHSNRKSLKGILRAGIGTFADQVYPILALVEYGNVFGENESKLVALQCAERICQLQGPLGQWWWHYDSKTGNVLCKYPVYSVHQDGMAPMALNATANNIGGEFRGSIQKSLEWLTGTNELSRNMVVLDKSLIWRSVFPGKFETYYHEMLAMIKGSEDDKENYRLMLNRECRPYHLGWILFALSKNQEPSI
ncbi:MAG: hypothetical protein JRH08_04500 [Deltaproteobacteria bacterium]|nr:hypothetical protein [Deltaproteobacteria bacterium]MBW2124961.1 hypothetical protein [Deltaproteobacteria bacterium]